MFKRIIFIFLGLSLVLFSGCVSHSKYRGLETELKSIETQKEEDEIAFKNLQIQKSGKESIREK